MDAEVAAVLAEARAKLADYKSRVTMSLSDSHLLVRKTEALIAEARELISMALT